MDLRISIFQIDLAWEKPSANRKKLARQLSDIAPESDAAIFPEMFASGFTMKAADMAEHMDGPSIGWMREMAAKHELAVAGSLIIEENGQYYNRFVWVSPDGSLTHYDKRHLFSLSEEPRVFTPGKSRQIIDYFGWKIFPQICYDLRFPVWARNDLGYDIYLNVANWPVMRSAAWNILLQARAIENQVYAIGVNRFGKDGHEIYHAGDSSVIDPLGRVMLKISDEENVKTVTLKKEELYKIRRKLPFLNDRDHFTII
jgi:predicted amidohydrolase